MKKIKDERTLDEDKRQEFCMKKMKSQTERRGRRSLDEENKRWKNFG